MLQDYWYVARRSNPAAWNTAHLYDQEARLKFIQQHVEVARFRSLIGMTGPQADATAQQWGKGVFADWIMHYSAAKKALERVAVLLGLASPLESRREWTLPSACEAEIRTLLQEKCCHFARAGARNPVPKTKTGLIRSVWKSLLGLDTKADRRVWGPHLYSAWA